MSYILSVLSLSVATCYERNDFVFSKIYSNLSQDSNHANFNKNLTELFYHHGYPHHYYTPCIRLLNSTHQFGCKSTGPTLNRFGGNTGKAMFIRNQTDVDQLINKKEHFNIIAIFDIRLTFNGIFSEVFDRIDKLNSVGDVKGVIIGPSTHLGSMSDQEYSADKGFESNGIQWNPNASSHFLKEYNFPIFFVHELKIIKHLEICSKFNTLKKHLFQPHCAAFMQYWPIAAGNSLVCSRRYLARKEVGGFLGRLMSKNKFCSPVSGHNVMVIWPPKVDFTPLKPKSVIVLIARLDSLSIFYNWAMGYETVISAVSFLLVVASQLRSIKPKNCATNSEINDRRVLFLFLNGESANNIGSKSVAKQLQDKGLRISPNLRLTRSDIAAVIEFSQLGQWFRDKKSLFLYSNGIDEFLPSLKSVLNPSFSQHLPPLSGKVFDAVLKDVPVYTIMSYNNTFHQRHHSMFDMPPRQPTTLATIRERAMQFNTFISIFLNRTIPTEFGTGELDKFVRCFIERPGVANHCHKPKDHDDIYGLLGDAFPNRIINVDNVLESFARHKRSKFNTFPSTNSIFVRAVEYLLTIMFEIDSVSSETYEEGCKTPFNCHNLTHNQNGFTRSVFGGGRAIVKRCYFSQVTTHLVTGQAFSEVDINSDSFWSISKVHQEQNSILSIFMVASVEYEIFVFLIGISVFICSFTVMYLIRDKLDLLFGNDRDCHLFTSMDGMMLLGAESIISKDERIKKFSQKDKIKTVSKELTVSKEFTRSSRPTRATTSNNSKDLTSTPKTDEFA